MASNLVWQNNPPNYNQLRISRIETLTEFGPAVRPGYEFNTFSDAFKLYFDETLMEKIVLYTNQSLKEHGYDLTTTTELYGLFGNLFLIGFFKDSTITVARLWSKNFGRLIYNGVMSKSRFIILTSYITFDDIYKEGRDDPKSDKYVKIQHLIEYLNERWTNVYSPSPNLTVDETLSLFRGRTSFLTYMPSKPGKYGILLRTLACSESRY